MGGGDLLEVLAGSYYPEIDAAQRVARTLEYLLRNHLYGAVDALQPLEIHLQAVEKDAVQSMARDLRKRRLAMRSHAFGVRHELAPYADHEQLLGAQVQGRADGRDLAHRAVAEVFAVDMHRREDEWHRARG